MSKSKNRVKAINYARKIKRLHRTNHNVSKRASPVETSKCSITTLEGENRREMYLPCNKTKNKLRKATMLGKKLIHRDNYNNAVVVLKGLGFKDYWNYM